MNSEHNAKNKNITILLACLGFIGLAGMHKFYQGKIITGFLYFFTFGFFGIGTIIDLIFLIKSNHIGSSDSNEKVITQKQNYEHTQLTSSNLQAIKSSVNLKGNITPEELNYEEVLQRYLTTSHISAPNTYGFSQYFEAEFKCLLDGIPTHLIKLTEGDINRNKEINLCPNYLRIRSNTNPQKLKNFVSVDVETTGLSTGGGDILEIAAIKWVNFHPVSIFTTLCKPRKSIPVQATEVNNITNEMVANAPNFKCLVSDLEQFISGFPIVAHNAPFDLKFLYVYGLSAIESWDAYDTLQLSRDIVRDYDGEKLDSYKLTDVCNEMSIYFNDAHRARADALAAGLLFIELIKNKKSTDNIMSLL